jgi:hypothetical protein
MNTDLVYLRPFQNCNTCCALAGSLHYVVHMKTNDILFPFCRKLSEQGIPTWTTWFRVPATSNGLHHCTELDRTHQLH